MDSILIYSDFPLSFLLQVESRPPPQEKRLFATNSLQHNTSILPSPPVNPTEGAMEAGKDGGGGGEGAGGEALDVEEAVALYLDLCGGGAEGNNNGNNDDLEGVEGASAGVGKGGSGGGGGGGGGVLTHDRLSTALRGHPRVMQRLSGRSVYPANIDRYFLPYLAARHAETFLCY